MFRVSTTIDFKGWRSTSGALIAVAVVVRLAAALVLLYGPWTDEPAELSGWDVERFTAIATADERPWTATEVEYPPGSVVVFEAANGLGRLAHDTAVVGTHRVLVVAMLAADLATAALLGRRFGQRAVVYYLLLGLPLVPMGLLRLDLVTTFLAVVAVVGAFPPTRTACLAPAPTPTTRMPSAIAASAVALAAAVKVWPAVVVAPLWLLGRRGVAAASIGIGAVAAAAWLAWADVGLDPVYQVLSLRGASGWHVESTPGLLTTLGRLVSGGDTSARLELNAFRIGVMSPVITSIGRVIVLATLVALGLRARAVTRGDGPDLVTALAAVSLGTVAALLVTAPLFSPQFMLWLTPWVAILAARRHPPSLAGSAITVAAVIGCVLTGGVLAVFGPGGITDPIPTVLLAVRNATVAVLPVACWFRLGQLGAEVADGGSGPRLKLPDSEVDQVAPVPEALRNRRL